MDMNIWRIGTTPRASTVRAPHQLVFLAKSANCDYCRIVCHTHAKTKFRCPACNLTFCFTRDKSDCRKWHSEECDHYRGYS